MADTAHDQVTLEADVPADFEVVHAELALAVLEHPLNPPAAERDQKQHLHRRLLGRVAEEVLDLIGIEHVASDEQVVRSSGKSVRVRQPHQDPLGRPHDGPLGAILDSILLPRLSSHDR